MKKQDTVNSFRQFSKAIESWTDADYLAFAKVVAATFVEIETFLLDNKDAVVMLKQAYNDVGLQAASKVSKTASWTNGVSGNVLVTLADLAGVELPVATKKR